jgi:hypothetical protein
MAEHFDLSGSLSKFLFCIQILRRSYGTWWRVLMPIPSTEQAVTELRVAAEVLFFRPLKRAEDVLALWQPQSCDWGYPMPPAEAG